MKRSGTASLVLLLSGILLGGCSREVFTGVGGPAPTDNAARRERKGPPGDGSVPAELFTLLKMDSKFPAAERWVSSAGKADIRAERSRSLLRFLAGPGAVRMVFWPEGSEPGTPDLNRARLGLNYDREGKLRSAEILFRDPVSQAWEASAFEFNGLDWNRIEVLSNRPTRQLCAACHTQGDRLSPLVSFIETREDLLREGYFDEALIQRMLEIRD